MKTFRNIFILGVSALISCACSSDDAEREDLPVQELTDIRIVAPDFVFDQHTRLISHFTGQVFQMEWEKSDTLGILPDVGGQVAFPIMTTNPEQPNQARFTGGGWALKSAATYAAYYPYIGNSYLDKTSIPLDFTGQWQKSNGDLTHLGRYIYMAAQAQTPQEGAVNLLLQHLGCYTIFELMIPEPTDFGSITFCAEEPLFVDRAKLNLTLQEVKSEVVSRTDSLTFSLEGVRTTAANEKLTLYFMFAPTELKNKTFKAVVRDIDGYVEEVVIAGKGFEAGHAYLFSDLTYVTYTQVAAPHWTFDEATNDFQTAMTAVVTLPPSMQKFMGEGDELAAFVNGELRGVGKRIGNAFYLAVCGNIGEVGKVSFRYYNHRKQYLYEANSAVDFNSDLVFGTADHPEILPLKVVK